MKHSILLSIAIIFFVLAVGGTQASLNSTKQIQAITTTLANNSPSQGVQPQEATGASTAAGSTLSPSPEETQQTAATIIRTIVYRRISDFQEGGGISNINRIKLSADGSKIIFISGPKVFTMDATGQNLRQVFDAENLREPYWIDISANGAKIMWATGYGGYFYTADSDGSNRVAINPGFKTNYGSDDILGLAVGPRMTADGSRVYFTHSGALENTGGYRVNVNNTGLTKLFSFEQIAALFGKDGSVYNGNTAFSGSLVISDNGSRLVFGTANFDNLGQTVAYDSATGLHKLTNYLASYADRYIAISGDGSTVVVVGATGYPENRSPAYAMDFSGGNSREIIHDMNAFGSAVGVMEMTTNGAQVLSNAGKTTSILYTDGSGRLDLNVFRCDLPFADPVGGANAGHDANPIFGQSLAADGRRFAFVSRQNPNQLWVADINPSTPGDNPVISEVNFNPTWVLADGSTSSTFTARVTGGQGGIRHSCIDSLKNNAYQFRAFSGDLFDDGTHGDTTAADSLYTNNNVRRDLAAADQVSPYTARIYGYANSLKQITVVDAVPFFILNTPPAGSGPHIDSLNPSSGPVGIEVTINGSGFDPTPSNNIVLFDSRQAFVKSASANRNTLVVIVPPELLVGTVPVTVTVAAQTSNAVNFTVTGNAGVTVTDHKMSGGPIPGACATPSAKNAFAPTDALAIQWTLISGAQSGDLVRWEWIQPNGSIYRQNQFALSNSGQVCFWDGVDIAGQQAASLPGNWQVRVFVKGAQILTENFTISQGGGSCPAITGVSPSSGAVGTSVTITGTGFNGVNGVKFANNVSATFNVVSDTQITATVPGGATTGAITVTEPNCNDAQSPTPFTVTQPSGRIVRVVCGSTTVGGTLTVPVELISQGNENALSFSLTFDPAVLSNPQATRGSDASGAALNVNANQTAQGRFGVALALPTGQNFTAGTRQIAVVTFAVSASTAATSTTIGFGDSPILRRVSDANAEVLPATYQADTCATIAILRGYEADVTPRPAGKNDGTVSINDWVMIGRFAAALDTPAAGSEFQRADCAPRSTKGDGLVAVDDWVQAGRYYAALDAVQTIGGPASPAAVLWRADARWRSAGFLQPDLQPSGEAQPAIFEQLSRVVRVANATFVRGQANTLSIELDSQGNENAVGFSLNFDPNVLTYVSAATGSDAPNAFLIINNSQAASGRLGLAVAQPAGEKFAAGTRQVVTVRFNAATASTAATTTISFGDQPVRRQIADANAGTLTATYADGAITLVNSVACVSAASFRATDVASEAIIAAFGVGMATGVQVATTVPLPTQLAGTTVTVRDSTGMDRLAPLFFVSPNQINYQMPPGTAAGQTTVTVRSGNGTVSVGAMPLAAVGPGLFTANATGQGVAAAVVLRVKADGALIYEPVSQWDTARQQYVSLPIDLGPQGEQVYLILFGTGLRFLSSQSAASVIVGGSAIPVLYVGPQGDFVGLDQINLGPLPRTLSGRGELNVVLMVDGQTANTVTVNLR